MVDKGKLASAHKRKICQFYQKSKKCTNLDYCIEQLLSDPSVCTSNLYYCMDLEEQLARKTQELEQYKKSKQASYEVMQEEWNKAINEKRKLKQEFEDLKSKLKNEKEAVKIEIKNLNKLLDYTDKQLQEAIKTKCSDCESVVISENGKLCKSYTKSLDENHRYCKALEEIEKIAQNGLSPICYKSNCSCCRCYDGDDCNISMTSLINNYFTENGEFVDGSGDFVEALEGLLESERKKCNKAQPIAQRILDIINKAKEEE